MKLQLIIDSIFKNLRRTKDQGTKRTKSPRDQAPKLPGRTHTDVGVQALRREVVHTQTIRVEVTHAH